MMALVTSFSKKLASDLFRGRTAFGLLLLLSLNTFNCHATQSASYDTLFESLADNEQLQALADRLLIGETASGSFTQYRTLKVLKKPLISHGRFIFDYRLGLVWQQTHPFETTLILKGGELIQIDSAGRRQVSQAGSNQGAAAIAQTMPKLLSALLSGNLSELSEHFNLYLRADDTLNEPRTDETAHWLLGLIPKDPLLIKAIPQMVLEGEKQASSLTLLNNNGDSSRIEFKQINKAPLNEEQRLLLSDKQGETSPKVQPAAEPELYP